MGKSQGLIGNFNGKVGNMVGFKVSQSNNGTSQGVRIYQPVRKNPKTAAQAEQRAKYAPIFATYRALKSIIERGQESKPYGNASRIAWLKKAFRSAMIPWTPQGSTVTYPLGCQLTQGSLNNVSFKIEGEFIVIPMDGVHHGDNCRTIGQFSSLILTHYPDLKEGDQVTLVIAEYNQPTLQFNIISYILNSNDETAIQRWFCTDGHISFDNYFEIVGAAIIVSREGAHGEHLRSSSLLTINPDFPAHAPYDAASKQAAIISYMTSGAENLDWSEEPI